MQPICKVKKHFVASLSLIIATVGLTGCQNPFAQKVEPVKEPPFIPAPQALVEEAKPEIPALYVGAFADMMEYGDKRQHNPKLVDAVAHAIRIGVLKPNGVQDRFNAENPISFSEFRTWTIAYQSAAAGTSKLKPESPASGKNKPRELASIVSRTDTINSPMNPAKLTLLPASPRFGDYALTPNSPLNREALCALYVLLAEKQELANTMTPDALEAIAPGDGNLNGDESLAMFKDYTSISEWAKPYVAIAYQQGILHKVFNLTGTRLTIDEGFRPQSTITREEGILLLHTLYGYVKSPAPVEPTPASRQKPTTNSGNAGMKGQYTPQKGSPESSTLPFPVAKQSQINESSPLGSRSAQQVKAAE